MVLPSRGWPSQGLAEIAGGDLPGRPTDRIQANRVKSPLRSRRTPRFKATCGEVRLELQGPPVAGRRFVRLSLTLQGKAQVVPAHRDSPVSRQCPAVAGHAISQHPWSLKAVPKL